MSKLKPLIVILGPTASGKSNLAVKLALRLCSGQVKKKFRINGAEIISTDSRQVYKGMDIGTGKIRKKEMQGIPHYLLDVVSPKRKFTVAQYRKLAQKAICKIHKNNKVPFLVGGTGFYIQAVVDGIIIPKVKPDWQLRKKLEKKETKELFKLLGKLDSRRAKTIDKKNRRRLIRALEILIKTKKPVPKPLKLPPQFDVLMIGVEKKEKELERLIEKRFFRWLRQGLFKEIIKIRKFGLSWQRIEEFGLHYRATAQYLQKKISYKEMVENSLKELKNYTKRQMTWFKRDKRIHWIKGYQTAEKLTDNFLRK